MQNQDKEEILLSGTLIRLMQGPIYHDQRDIWNRVLTRLTAIDEYFFKLNLRLVVDEQQGYAFLQSRTLNSSDVMETESLPTLIPKRALSYEITVLLVLLRERLDEFDSSVRDDERPIIHEKEIISMLSPFYPTRTNEVKQVQHFQAMINKVLDMGILKRLKNDENIFEIRRILKAMIDSGKLEDIKSKLVEFSKKNQVVAGE